MAEAELPAFRTVAWLAIPDLADSTKEDLASRTLESFSWAAASRAWTASWRFQRALIRRSRSRSSFIQWACWDPAMFFSMTFRSRSMTWCMDLADSLTAETIPPTVSAPQTALALALESPTGPPEAKPRTRPLFRQSALTRGAARL